MAIYRVSDAVSLCKTKSAQGAGNRRLPKIGFRGRKTRTKRKLAIYRVMTRFLFVRRNPHNGRPKGCRITVPSRAGSWDPVWRRKEDEEDEEEEEKKEEEQVKSRTFTIG